MKDFKALRRQNVCTQINNAPAREVFPLLCPVREKYWIDGWDFTMIYSRSGFAEEAAVFTTPNNGNPTTWYVTRYDTEQFIWSSCVSLLQKWL